MSRRERIVDALNAELSPEALWVENESHNHKGPKDAETHFKVVIVSDRFEGKSLIERHRLVYGALENELAQKLHAVAITSRTPAEWAKNPEPLQSPPCASKRLT